MHIELKQIFKKQKQKTNIKSVTVNYHDVMKFKKFKVTFNHTCLLYMKLKFIFQLEKETYGSTSLKKI